MKPRERWVRRWSVLLMAGIVLAGLLIGYQVSLNGPALAAKFRGDAPDCPWMAVGKAWSQNKDLDGILRGLERRISVQSRDEKMGIELIRTPKRSFWIKEGQGQGWSGKRLLAYLLAEHDWVELENPKNMVRPGDVVLDCGAQVGVFTSKALERGAARVIAIEPDPTNLECLKRNFTEETASGKVVIVPKGVWSSTTELILAESKANSGSNSVVEDVGGAKFRIQVTTIDSLVSELHLSRVDYIKMDIEGAEREALKGALACLRDHRPRLMVDSYHLPDDPRVVPDIIRMAHSDYSQTSGPCELDGRRLVPHVTFYR